MNFENTIEIIKQKSKYGEIFILEHDDGNLYICRTPSIKEFKAWSEVCTKLDLNSIITAMSIAYITQVYPQERMPEDIAATIGSDIINSTPIGKEAMKAEYNSYENITVIDWLVYNAWQLTGIQPSELEEMSVVSLIKLYKAACNTTGAPSVFDEDKPEAKKSDMFSKHQSSDEMNSKFDELKNKFESMGLDIENIDI